jgi:hypothetical protein
MVGSFNGFGRFSIEGVRREDGVGHHFEKRRTGGAVDSASLGVEELAGGIGMAAARGRWRKMMVRVGRKANRPAEPEWCRFR